MSWKLEVTDTFGGEANYCWVKRGVTRRTSRRGIIQAVKELAGWDGWCRVKVESWGDGYKISPVASSGISQVAFAHWEEESDEN